MSGGVRNRGDADLRVEITSGEVDPIFTAWYNGSRPTLIDLTLTNDLSVANDALISGDLEVVGLSTLDDIQGASANFGNATDYTGFDTDGVQTMAGDARVYKHEWLSPGAIKAPGAKPATAIAQGTLEVPAWQFANQAVAGNQETISFKITAPQEMDRSVAGTVKIGFSSTTNAGNVKWQLEYLWVSEDEDTTAAAEGTVTTTDAVSTTAEGMVVAEFTGLNAPSATDICAMCRLTRLSADVADTVADTVELHGVCLNYVSNKLGIAL